MSDVVGDGSNGGDSSAVLDRALEQLRLEGAIFFRSELTESSPSDWRAARSATATAVER